MMPFLEKIRDTWKPQLQALVTKVEESVFFERLVMRYEALEPQQQRNFRSGAVLAAALAITMVLLIPLATSLGERSRVTRYQDLLTRMKLFNAENELIRRPAPKPAGWQSLDSSTLEAFKESLGQFLAQTGIPDDSVEISGTGNDIEIKVKELSIRQAVTIIFQVDGWFPVGRMQNYTLTVNLESKDLLSMDALVVYNPAAAAAAAAAPPVPEEGSVTERPQGEDNEEGVARPPGGAGAGPPPQGNDEAPLVVPPGVNPGGQPVLPSYPPTDDFTGDLPPPPFEDDL